MRRCLGEVADVGEETFFAQKTWQVEVCEEGVGSCADFWGVDEW